MLDLKDAAVSGPSGARPGLREHEATLLRQAQLFIGIEPEDVEAVIGRFGVHTLSRRDEVFAQGDTAPADLYVVLSGGVMLTRRTAEGVATQARTNFIGPGETFGELSVFDPGPRASTAIAALDSRLAYLDRQSFMDWCLRRPYAVERLLHVLARRLRRSDDRSLDLMFVDVGGRLATLILDLSARFGVSEARGIRINHGLSQQELAQLVGSTRETVNKFFRQFGDRGWVESTRGGFIILDAARLQDRARASNSNPPLIPSARSVPLV